MKVVEPLFRFEGFEYRYLLSFLGNWALQMMNSIYHDPQVKDRFFELQRFIPMAFELAFFQGKFYIQRRAHPRHYQDFFTFAP